MEVLEAVGQVKRQRLRPDDLDIEPDQMKRSLKGERRG